MTIRHVRFIKFFAAKAILFRYYKVCNFDIEEAKKLLDINVKFRIKHQYLFDDRDIDTEEFLNVAGTV